MRTFFKGKFFFSVALFAIIYLLFSDIFTLAKLNVYAERDFFRSIDLFAGHLIWHGPELSGGGFSPGPFFYYLIGLPSYFFGYNGLIALEIGLLSLGMVCLWLFLNHLHSGRIAWVALIILLNSNVVIIDLLFVWNPAFIFFFWVVLLISLVLSVDKAYADIAWPVFCIVLGLTVQIHVMTFFWFLIPMIFVSRNIISTKKLIYGFGILLALQVPFLIWYTTHLSEFAVFPALHKMQEQTLLQYLQSVFSLYSDRIDSTVIFSAFRKYFDFKTISVLLCMIIFSLFLVQRPNKEIRNTCYLLAISFILAMGSLITFSTIHYYLPFIGLLIYLCYLVHKALSPPQRKNLEIVVFLFYIVFSVYLIFSNRTILSQWLLIKLFLIFVISVATALFYKEKKILFLMGLLALSIQSQLMDQVPGIDGNIYTSRDTARKIAAIIYENTGWQLTEMKKRILYIPLAGEKSLSSVYSEVLQNQVKHKDPNATGYIIAPIVGQVSDKPYDWLTWVKLGLIKITKEDTIGGFSLLKFEKNDQSFPNKIQNEGEGYPRWNESYTNQFQAFKRFEVPTYNGDGPVIAIYWDEISKEIIFYARELAVSHSIGASLFIEDLLFTFFCDAHLKTIRIKEIGFPPRRNFYAKLKINILAPLWYSVADCSNVRPVNLSAKKMILLDHRAGSSVEQRKRALTDVEYSF